MSEELDRIALEAGADEAEQEAKQDAIENPAPAMDPALAWAQLPAMVGNMLAMAMPELKAAYTDEACYQWGTAMSMVAEKYGWKDGAARFAPEIAIVLASVPLVLPTVQAIKSRRAAGEQKPALTEGGQAPEASQ